MNPLIRIAMEKKIDKSALAELEMKAHRLEMGMPHTDGMRQREHRRSVETESPLESRSPEQVTVDVVSRLQESGFTQERWTAADSRERTNMIHDAVRIISQEMLVEPGIRDKLQIFVSGEGASGSEVQTVKIDRSALEEQDCAKVYGQLYRGLLGLNMQGIAGEIQADILQRSFFRAYQESAGIEKAAISRTDNLGNWKEIANELSPLENLRAVNPNYDLDRVWKINCQRCVPTYEMRMRGYDVTAKPYSETRKFLALNPFDVWINPDICSTTGDGQQEIEAAMKEWGDGTRVQVVVHWQFGNGGHTFVAEQRDGITHFLDPQTGEEDVSYYFDNVLSGETKFCRMDALQPSQHMLDCCKAV